MGTGDFFFSSFLVPICPLFHTRDRNEIISILPFLCLSSPKEKQRSSVLLPALLEGAGGGGVCAYSKSCQSHQIKTPPSHTARSGRLGSAHNLPPGLKSGQSLRKMLQGHSLGLSHSFSPIHIPFSFPRLHCTLQQHFGMTLSFFPSLKAILSLHPVFKHQGNKPVGERFTVPSEHPESQIPNPSWHPRESSVQGLHTASFELLLLFFLLSKELFPFFLSLLQKIGRLKLLAGSDKCCNHLPLHAGSEQPQVSKTFP